MEIKKGDRFRCIRHVNMEDGDLLYFRGNMYESDFDGCITGKNGDIHHQWEDEPGDDVSWREHFEKIEDNQEYLTMRGLGKQVASLYQKGIECNICDPLFPDENPNIRKTFLSLHDLLQFKNKRYGNSSLEPINVLSKVDSTTGLLQRADDKIARIKNSPELRKNDVADLIGYLVLICVSKGWDNFDEFKD